MPKRYALCLALVLASFPLWAGDSAVFADLGFSPDGSRYMFGQYGIQSNNLTPWAELYVVDVIKNNWVSGGKKIWKSDVAIVAGQDGSGALQSLIAENTALAKKNRIDHTHQGQLLYLAIEDENARNTHESYIEFRDFDDGSRYSARLIPWLEGKGPNCRSSFFIDFVRFDKNGKETRYSVGTPDLKRAGISAYRIRQVMAAPQGNALIFVIEQWHETANGPAIRYMVETLRL